MRWNICGRYRLKEAIDGKFEPKMSRLWRILFILPDHVRPVF